MPISHCDGAAKAEYTTSINLAESDRTTGSPPDRSWREISSKTTSYHR